jgi:hypothetical protein
MRNLIRRILREESEKNPKSKMEKLIEKMGLMSLIYSMGLDNILDTLEITKEELYQKYNPFKEFFTEEEFNKEFYGTIKHLSLYLKSHFYEAIKNKSSEETLEFVISGIIGSFHDRLINFDTETWIIPNTPELLKMIYGDRIKNDPKYIKWVYQAKNLSEDFTDYGDLSNPEKLQKDFDEYISTQNPRGVGKIHQSIGDNLKDTIDILKQDFNLNRIKYAGQGHFGMAFMVDDDKILKLTNNDDEIRGIKTVINIQKKLGRTVPGVIHYYDVKHYPNSNVYAILMDKVDLLSPEEETVYTTMYYEGSNYSDSDFWDEYDDDDEIRDGLIDKLQDRLQNPEEEDELESYDLDYDEIVNHIEKYRELLNKLEENGVPTADLHGGNIGVKDGELIHFDVMDF